ncbi:MAG TPA: sulfite exporter TauE/SafE family protein [Candidatus Kapabacteria bacterium]|nr:sulfite exporter TauE/SafE family protein [Candidatus Kapabacteria bacterium]
MPELLLAFGAGIFSSLHCIGMCGPIVMGCSTAQSPQPIQIDVIGSAGVISFRKQFIIPQALYHIGRILSYATIGVFAGIFGAAVVLSASIQQPVTISLGALMILAALFQLDGIKVARRKTRQGKMLGVLSAIVKSSSTESRFLVGLLTPLLPCGLLYGMVIHSAALHSPLLAAASMSSFALGAVPALLALATVSNKVSARLRKNGTRIAAAFIIVMGIVTILRGAGINTDPFNTHGDSSCSSTTQVLDK